MSSEIEYRGARFYKCALQVNSYKYNKEFRGGESQDEHIYNEQIFTHCRNNDIAVVGLADHGRVDSSKTLRCYLAQEGIVVFPGFEIASSEKIHMVCLYPENTAEPQLNQFLGQLMGANSSKLGYTPTHPSSLSCEEIAKKILMDQNGFWYAAHATGNNGLLRLSGAGDNYVHIWKNDDLVVAIQIPGKIEDLNVDDKKDLKKYRQIIDNKNPDYKREKSIVVINAKDISQPKDLSKSSVSCCVKMTDANFQAFKDAFKDPQSRIRLNHEIPRKPISAIKSIRWSGAGLFETQELALSDNLNTVIGGRGTGKSTLIESIRFVLDLRIHGADSKSVENIRSSNLKNSEIELTVRCGSQHGETYVISRRFGEAPIVKRENGEFSRMTPRDLLPEIELLGQNEILRIEENETNKLALLGKFLPNTQKFSDQIDVMKRKLSNNREKIISAQDKFDLIEHKINKEGKLEEQRQQYHKLGIEEKLKNSALLEKELRIKERIDNQFIRIREWLDQYTDIFDLNFLQDRNIQNVPTKALISQIRSDLEQLKMLLDNLIHQASQEIEKTNLSYRSKQEAWNEQSNEIRNQINQAIAQLPDQEGKSGKEIGSNYQKIISDLTSIQHDKEEYERQKVLISTLMKERHSLLEEYRDTAVKRFGAMREGIKKLNKEGLRGKLRINVSRCKNIESLKDFMLNLTGVGAARIKWLDDVEEQIDLIRWSEWIKDKSEDRFKEKYSSLGLSDSTIDRLIAVSLKQRLELEEIELEDTVDIELNVAHEGEAGRYVPMENLSVGQKCTAILNLLLMQLNDPLIIDQPEDNLDNSFIAERIVSELRNLKTSRQFLFATHNANIPVFGDAELIVILENEGSKAPTKSVGSIDSLGIRGQAAQILEGGKAAFDMRKEKYGF